MEGLLGYPPFAVARDRVVHMVVQEEISVGLFYWALGPRSSEIRGLGSGIRDPGDFRFGIYSKSKYL